ncbi:hypothetical protein HanIR_Chr02g0068371 [Helianthus annuus]|nr:hypothetical protein HanIR_Chr02g0068371 [Helianthus annuus]
MSDDGNSRDESLRKLANWEMIETNLNKGFRLALVRWLSYNCFLMLGEYKFFGCFI